jgi:hypothetical protein
MSPVQERASFAIESTYTDGQCGALGFIAARHAGKLIVTSSHPSNVVRAWLIVRVKDGDGEPRDYWISREGCVYVGEPGHTTYRESVRTDEIVFEWS